MDCIDMLRVSFKFPFTVSFELNCYKGAKKLCTPIYYFCYKNKVQAWKYKIHVMYILPKFYTLYF